MKIKGESWQNRLCMGTCDNIWENKERITFNQKVGTQAAKSYRS